MAQSTLPIDLPMTALAALCRRYQVQELSLFGSALRDDFRPESDLDVLVLFKPGAKVTLLDLAGLQIDLTELLGREVDVVPKLGLKEVIRDEVLASARVLYAAE